MNIQSSVRHVLRNTWLWHLARVLLTTVFLTSGLGMLVNFEAGVRDIERLGLAPATLWNALVVLTLIGGSVLILLDRYMWIAALVLGGFLGLTILLVHHFWSLPSPRSIAAMHVALEHISLIGGLLAAAIASSLRAASKEGSTRCSCEN